MNEDNSLSDGEKKDSSEPVSPQMGGKKIKLNDGTSQHSLQETDITEPACGCSTQETGPSTSKNENMDSGVSVDKSESTSADDKSASTSSGLSNAVVAISASGSNVRTILMNIRQPNRCRNYRKRRTPMADTDSNGSSRDSDDLSAAEEPVPTSQPSPEYDNDSLLEADSADLRRLMELCRSDTDNSNPSHHSNESSSSSSSSSSVNNDYESDVHDQMHTGETDTEDEATEPDGEGTMGFSSWTGVAERMAAGGDLKKMPEVLLKERPKHNYLMLKEIINREMGLTFPYGKTTKEDVMFTQRFYGSLHSVYRLKKLHSLNKHRGCVNSINFHPAGQLLVSGSDDKNIVIWDWASKKALQCIKTGHKSNVFQSKFLYLNAESQLNIVTCARDGQVRLLQCPASGGPAARRRLFTHSRAAHKLHVTPHEPHSVLSAGEDGLVMHADVRSDQTNRLFQVKEKDSNFIPLYSVHGHPLDPNELIVAGRDRFIRMYDRRKCAMPIAQYSPTFFDKTQTAASKARLSLTHLTCAIYNHNGKQILGSYNDEDIYLFDVTKDAYDKEKEGDISIDGYSRRYAGHRNSATFKGVSFFGPHSEYVVSGSDCAHIYIWSARHEAIVQWLKGDSSGVVNCIEAHPRHPVLATSGLDRDVKIWIPRAPADPAYEGLEKVVRNNGLTQVRSPLFNDFLPTLYSAWRNESRSQDNESPPNSVGNIEFDGNVCTAF